MSVVGDVTDSSLSWQQNRIESDAVDVSQSIKDELESLRSKKTVTNVCRATSVLDEMDDEVKEIYQRLLTDFSVRATWIAEVLIRHGIRITAYSISRHRRAMQGREGCFCEFE